MPTIPNIRPFNTRYVIRDRSSRYTPELLRTHRTAQASYAYINRQNSVDEWGPTPNWASRSDLAAAGRSTSARAAGPKLAGISLWAQADENAARDRPDEPTIAHCVGSLPRHEDLAFWRNLIEGFAEDYLVARGMVVDWAIHHQAESDDQRTHISSSPCEDTIRSTAIMARFARTGCGRTILANASPSGGGNGPVSYRPNMSWQQRCKNPAEIVSAPSTGKTPGAEHPEYRVACYCFRRIG